jgi:hypothetical protein
MSYPTQRFFHYEHLPPHLRTISKSFHDLAEEVASRTGVDGRETAACLRKLLEAKDCAVRAALSPAPCRECDGKASYDQVANVTVFDHSENCALRPKRGAPVAYSGNHA